MLEQKTKPKVELKTLNAVVLTSTKENIDTLMKIYELAGDIEWKNGDSPINGSSTEKRWAIYKEKTCISVTNKKLNFGHVHNYSAIFSFEQFCEENKINQEKLKEINEYFKK